MTSLRYDLTDTLIEAIDERTSVVAVSSVQYATGTVVDVSRLRQSTVQVGARLIVDATQAAGAVRVDAAAWDADAVVASGYKWLGGHGGVALAVMSPLLLEQIPPLPGWMGASDPFGFDATSVSLANDARRYTQSTMSYATMAGLVVAVEQLLSLGEARIEAHARSLAAMLAILLGLHTSFHWGALAKAYKQLWKAFVVTILCAVHVADAFGSHSPLTTTQAMSTLLSKHLQGDVRDEFQRSKLHDNQQQHGKSQRGSFLVENVRYFARKSRAYAPRGVGCVVVNRHHS